MDKVGESVYNIIEVVGSSSHGWEEATRNALETASKKLTNLRIAEIVKMDVRLAKGNIVVYRVKIKLSFKNELEPETL